MAQSDSMAENQSGETLVVDEQLDSSLESVDAAEASVLKIAEETGFDEEALHKIGMAVRESMVNAVVHGNRYSGRKKVHLRVSTAADHLAVVVRDEGEGFEFENLPDPLSEENLLRQSGRGLLLMQAFVDRLDVRRHEAGGTEVRMVKYLSGG